MSAFELREHSHNFTKTVRGSTKSRVKRKMTASRSIR